VKRGKVRSSVRDKLGRLVGAERLPTTVQNEVCCFGVYVHQMGSCSVCGTGYTMRCDAALQRAGVGSGNAAQQLQGRSEVVLTALNIHATKQVCASCGRASFDGIGVEW